MTELDETSIDLLKCSIWLQQTTSLVRIFHLLISSLFAGDLVTPLEMPNCVINVANLDCYYSPLSDKAVFCFSCNCANCLLNLFKLSGICCWRLCFVCSLDFAAYFNISLIYLLEKATFVMQMSTCVLCVHGEMFANGLLAYIIITSLCVLCAMTLFSCTYIVLLERLVRLSWPKNMREIWMKIIYWLVNLWYSCLHMPSS